MANRLVDPETAESEDPTYPLDVVFCEQCALVQLGHVLPADEIFDTDYPYFSSFSDQLCEHSARHALDLIRSRALDESSLVVEVASNDGYLLRSFVDEGIPALGIEPTPGPASAARELGIPTIEAFFDESLARQLVSERGPADVVIANNVMAHVPELNSFVAGLAHLVSDDGIVTVENPSVRRLIEHVEFDTIYHEHYCYFSTTAVHALMRRHGLGIVRVDEFPDLHGGTLRWTMQKGVPTGDAVQLLLDAERAAGVGDVGFYHDFGARVAQLQSELLALLRGLKSAGHSIAAYGAAAKGATLLNTSGIDRALIDFVVDRNPHKQGKLIPGVRLPICPPEAIQERSPDYILLLAWNMRDEIVSQQQDYLRTGGRFIVPVPVPAVL